MTLRLYRYFQALVMLFLGIFLATKIVSGTLSWYIHQRFMPLTALAVIALFVIGQAVFNEARRTPRADHQPDEIGEHDHQHVPSIWQIGIVAIPLLIGLLIPAQPLNTEALSGKGVSASAPITAGGAGEIKFDQAADERNILDWIRLAYSAAAPDTYLGQSANVIGFVYHDPRLPAGQFMVSRFALVCCTADAFALGMVVEWPESAALPADAWIKVKGPVTATELDGQKMLLIRATAVTEAQPPDQPYLFP
jgi:uncharacterized repeat protein (TIGR03943 family)